MARGSLSMYGISNLVQMLNQGIWIYILRFYIHRPPHPPIEPCIQYSHGCVLWLIHHIKKIVSKDLRIH